MPQEDSLRSHPWKARRKNFEWNRWCTFAAGIMAMFLSGPIFTFGVIHSAIKDLLGATELQVQLIGVAGDIGLWAKLLPGLCFDRFGARMTFVVGAVFAGTGYAMMWVALKSAWSPTAVAFAWFLAGQGSGFVYLAALFASTKNFAWEDRGYVTGVLACAFGTSAAVLSSLYGGCLGGHVEEHTCIDGWIGGSVPDYMLMLAVAAPSFSLLAAVFSHVHEGSEPGDGDHANRRFACLYILLLALIVTVFGMKLAGAFLDQSISSWGNYIVMALIAVFLLLPLGAGPARQRLPSTSSETNAPSVELVSPHAALGDASGCFSSSDELAGDQGVCRGRPNNNGKQDEDTSPTTSGDDKVAEIRHESRSAFQHPVFWILFFVFGITVGADLMTLNIISAEVVSRDMKKQATGVLVVVQMGFDTLGRLCSGLLAGKIVPDTGLLLLAPILTVLGQALLACAPRDSLYVACALLGASDGMMWTAGPLYVARVFGLQHVGFNFGVAVLGAAVFQAGLSLLIEPAVYTAHLQPGEEVCHGAACFANLHWIAFGLACCAVVGAVHIHRHTSSPEDVSRL